MNVRIRHIIFLHIRVVYRQKENNITTVYSGEVVEKPRGEVVTGAGTSLILRRVGFLLGL